MPGRIDAYLHSDSVQENKAAALVCVTSETDFGSKTQEFKDFTKWVAKMVLGFNADTWKDLIVSLPEAEERRLKLEKEIKEAVSVKCIRIMRLPIETFKVEAEHK